MSKTMSAEYKYYICKFLTPLNKGFPGGSVVKNLPANVADVGSVSGLGRSPAEENGNPLQYSYLGNPMGKEGNLASFSPWGCKELDMTSRLNHNKMVIQSSLGLGGLVPGFLQIPKSTNAQVLYIK